MPGRKDALVGAARMIDVVDRIAREEADAVGTVGALQVSPGSRNTVPGKVSFTIDLRHFDAQVLARMDRRCRSECVRIAGESGLGLDLEEIWYQPPVRFDPGCIEAVRRAAGELGYAHRDIVSGAGHDSFLISRVAPTAMIFVPCAGGVSHNEEESAEPADLGAGADVLLHAMLSRAGA
jgi:N-carbamoyl-L-amino-acid hydrolase